MDADIKEKVTESIQRGLYADSIASLRGEISRRPEDVEAKMMLGLCCQMSGDEGECLRIYEEVRPQMELREASGEQSEVVSFWQKYRKLVAALLIVGVVPFCNAADSVVTNALGNVKIVPHLCQGIHTMPDATATNADRRIKSQYDMREVAKVALTTNDFMLVIRSDGEIVAVAKGIASETPEEEPDKRIKRKVELKSEMKAKMDALISAQRIRRKVELKSKMKMDAMILARENFAKGTKLLHEMCRHMIDPNYRLQDDKSGFRRMLQFTRRISEDGVLLSVREDELVGILKKWQLRMWMPCRPNFLTDEHISDFSTIVYVGDVLGERQLHKKYGVPIFPDRLKQEVHKAYGVPLDDDYF